MVYVLEFLVLEADGKRILDRMTHRAKTVEHARDHARSIMKNVKLRDQKAHLCQVKDQMGNILGVVPAE